MLDKNISAGHENFEITLKRACEEFVEKYKKILPIKILKSTFSSGSYDLTFENPASPEEQSFEINIDYPERLAGIDELLTGYIKSRTLLPEIEKLRKDAQLEGQDVLVGNYLKSEKIRYGEELFGWSEDEIRRLKNYIPEFKKLLKEKDEEGMRTIDLFNPEKEQAIVEKNESATSYPYVMVAKIVNGYEGNNERIEFGTSTGCYEAIERLTREGRAEDIKTYILKLIRQGEKLSSTQSGRRYESAAAGESSGFGRWANSTSYKLGKFSISETYLDFASQMIKEYEAEKSKEEASQAGQERDKRIASVFVFAKANGVQCTDAYKRDDIWYYQFVVASEETARWKIEEKIIPGLHVGKIKSRGWVVALTEDQIKNGRIFK